VAWREACGTGFVFICCAVCALLGIIITIFCIDDRRETDLESGVGYGPFGQSVTGLV